jgi:fructose-1,6-bisphosphatase/sedoheptulose 1,7-bisphosphatase-like protein
VKPVSQCTDNSCRLVPNQAERMRQVGIKDPKRVYSTQDLAPAKNIAFVVTGVTDGALLKGVRFFGDGVRTTPSGAPPIPITACTPVPDTVFK